jgi:hypothetical protein
MALISFIIPLRHTRKIRVNVVWQHGEMMDEAAAKAVFALVIAAAPCGAPPSAGRPPSG